MDTRRFSVIEQYIQSRKGNIDDCEDVLFINNYFGVVIDGNTTKRNLPNNHPTPGKSAALTIASVFKDLSPDATALQAVKQMTEVVKSLYLQDISPSNQFYGFQNRVFSATFASISFSRKELWIVGDCQALLNDELITQKNRTEELVSQVRAMMLEIYLGQGLASETDLLHKDLAREFIVPLLEGKSIFQNSPQYGSYWSAAIDGSLVPDQGIIVRSIPASTKEVVIATDGYPHLENTLSKTEKKLRYLLDSDPLMFRLFKSTKGVYEGFDSFDDRAYLRFRLD
jgi:hypothetical protein